MSNQDPRETVRLTLSPLEGERLFEFLTELEAEARLSGLEEFFLALDNAIALAQWKRENVRVELDTAEAFEAREALESISTRKGIASDAETLLLTVQNQLRQAAEFAPDFNKRSTTVVQSTPQAFPITAHAPSLD